MKNVRRLLAIILCVSVVFCSFGLVSVSASGGTFTQSDYEPGSPSVIYGLFSNNGTKAMLRLSWINPKADTLQSIKIYRGIELITTISNPTPGEVVEYTDKGTDDAGLTSGSFYTYRLVYNFSDRQTEVQLTEKAVAGYNEYVLRKSNSSTKKSKVYVAGSTDNMPGYSHKIVNEDGGYLQMSANVSADNTAWKRLLFAIGDLNTTTASTNYDVKITYKSDSDFNLGAFDFKKNTNWTELTKQVTSNTKGEIILYTDWVNSFYNLCIKSVEVYTIPAEGNEATMVDSWDCSIYNKKPEAVGNISTTLVNNNLTFDIRSSKSWWWNNGNDGNAHVVNYYNIYEVIGGERFLRAQLCRTVDTQTNVTGVLKNVSDGKHVYEITCSDFIGLESPAKTVSVTVMPYEPKNVTAIQQTAKGTDVGINVSWINPVATTLSKVSVYELDTATGEETLLSDKLDITPGKTVKYTDTGLTSNSTHTYRVQFDFTDHKSVEAYTSAMAANGVRRHIITNINNKVFSVLYDGTFSSVPGVVNKVTADGSNHYLDFRANIDAASNERAPIFITLDSAMDGSSTYTLSFKVKSENTENFDVYTGTFEDGNRKVTDYEIPASDNWTTVSCDVFAPWRAGSLFIVFKDTVEGLCIDDIKFTKKNDESTVLASKDFEDLGLKTPTATEPTFPMPAGGATAVAADGAATLHIAPTVSWWHAATDFKENFARTANCYNIYEDVNGIKVLRAKLTKPGVSDAIPSVKLSNLTNGKEYTYYVTSETNDGVVESEPITVKVTPQGSITVSEFALKGADGNPAANIAPGGVYSASVTVGNTTDKAVPAQMIVAVYDGNELKAAYLATAKNVETGAQETIIVENVTIPNDASDNVSLRCFLWDNLNTLTPLRDKATFTK